MQDSVEIRDAIEGDAPELARLSGQLGYPRSDLEAARGVLRYAGRPDRRIIVAAIDGKVRGWTSIEIVEHFYVDKYVEISGFVVDGDLRGRGIGKLIMSEALRWAAEKGHTSLMLRTNVTRTAAHGFYEGLGFRRTKTQHTYVRDLSG